MLQTLSSRLVLTHLIVAVMAVSLVGVLSSHLFRRYYVGQTQRELAKVAEDLAARIGRAMHERDAADRVALITWTASRSLGGRVCVFDSRSARLLASSDMRSGAAGQVVAGLPECDDVICTQIERTEVLCHPGPVISVMAPIYSRQERERLGVLLVRRPLREVEATLRLSTILVGLSGAVATAIALILAVVLARAISRPLASMAQTASQLADGDFTARAQRDGPLELHTLAMSLNQMADALAQAFADLSQERSRLADILSTMEEGVVSVDSRGRVVVANDSARRLLDDGGGDLTGRTFAELCGGLDLPDEYLEVVAGRDEHLEHVLRVGERWLRLHATPVKSGEGGAVLVIADVTEAERLEHLRREFVANASHELRAPITSIQGFLQALSDGTAATAEEREHCLALAAQQAELMGRLVNQLLDLSRLQAGVVVFERDALDLIQLVQGAVEALSPQARAKGVTVALEVGDCPQVHADGDRILQVLVNLLDNAIRYSPIGGRVVVTISEAKAAPSESREVVVSVADDGPGIPEADLPLIWERFHKADRSRQRTGGGGAGLGLAIAREIVLAHGGRVHAENRPEGGAKFSFSLPAAEQHAPRERLAV